MGAALSATIVEWQTALYLPEEWEEAFIEAQEATRQSGIEIVDVVALAHHPKPNLLVLAYPASAHWSDDVAYAMAAACDRQSSAPSIRLAVIACGESETPVLEQDVAIRLQEFANSMGRRHPKRCGEPAELRDEVQRWLAMTRSTIHPPPIAGFGNDYESETLIARDSGRKGKISSLWL